MWRWSRRFVRLPRIGGHNDQPSGIFLWAVRFDDAVWAGRQSPPACRDVVKPMTEFDVRHYDQLGSTNDEARRLAAEGGAHGVVIHADEQTSGRGRMARRWVSPPGNLYVSIL